MEPVPSSPGNSPASGQNRRKSPRFETLGRVLGHLIDADLPVRVREIGFGGFSIETIEPIPVDIVHQVRFTAYDDWTSTCEARSVHCRPSCAADGSPRFVTGFQFADEWLRRSEHLVKTLVEKITTTGMFS